MTPWQRLRHGLKRRVFRLVPARAQLQMDERHYARRIRSGTLVEEPELGVLDRFVGPGDAALDVGANLGAYAVELSRLVGPTGQVLAFEPIPRTFQLLSRLTRQLAPHPNVEVVQAAVGTEPGTASMYLPLEGTLPNFYVASLYPIHRDRTTLVDVTVTSLDAVRAGLRSRVAFLKIDVEGAELLVLRGGEQLIAADRPVILCEIGTTARDGSQTASDVETWLVDHGYQLHQLVDGDLVACTTAAPATKSPNYLALPG